MVKEEKLKAVEELRKAIDSYEVMGIIDMHKLPTSQIQQIKKKVRGQAEIRITKKAVLLHALEGVKKENLEEFKKLLPVMPGLILTSMDPFKFYGIVDKLKSPASAKEGDIAPNDIEVSAGPTNLLPGPAISELAKAGIQAGVEEGKISVKRDTVVAKKGAVINAVVASALKKLNILPMLIGMKVVAVYHKGMIYGKDVLSLVGEPYLNKLKEAFVHALNLSVGISYPTKENIGYLLSKAELEAKALENLIKKPEEKIEAPKEVETKQESGGVS
ncbi:MAG: 50S ribosomal protein L10 [Candidatus Aenigmarchaeota archaeon]|nr:50S ribosomal protein L10 [Candidatus Aenigmarchaeota archaeon]